ncbi:MAG: patatin-like phospholipase family protein [Thermoplasmatota archaeon]
MKALVLSGGGAKGAYQLGAYIGLHQQGYAPDCLVGTSVGAINGAFIASGSSPEEMRRAWLDIEGHVSKWRRDAWRFKSWSSLASTEPLRKYLQARIDWDALNGPGIPFTCTAVNTATGEIANWTREELTVEHLLASSAIPGLFPPITIGGQQFFDGGVVNNTPLRPAIRAGATHVLAIMAHPLQRCVPEEARNIPEVLARVTELHHYQALNREIRRGLESNEFLKKHRFWRKRRPIAFRWMGPSEPLEGNLMDFKRAKIASWLARGEADGAKYNWQEDPAPGKKR